MLLGRGLFRKRPGQHEFGLEHGSAAGDNAVEGPPNPPEDRMPQSILDAFDRLPGVALEPMPVEGFSHEPELDDEVAGQVLRLGLAPFLAPQAHQGGFIVAHDDAGVGAADEAAPADGLAKSYFNGCHLHPSLFNHHRCLLNSCSRVIINQPPAVVNSDRIGEISSPYD